MTKAKAQREAVTTKETRRAARQGREALPSRNASDGFQIHLGSLRTTEPSSLKVEEASLLMK